MTSGIISFVIFFIMMLTVIVWLTHFEQKNARDLKDRIKEFDDKHL